MTNCTFAQLPAGGQWVLELKWRIHKNLLSAAVSFINASPEHRANVQIEPEVNLIVFLCGQ